jgi:CheY-like chemotaxis protein
VQMPDKPVILCVDDLQENLKIRTMLLELRGYATISVGDHQSALRVVSEEHVDLILIDYHLSGTETGEDVARDIRVIHPEIPLLMLTGDWKVPDSARASVDAVLLKGGSSAENLLQTIATLLGRTKRPPVQSSPPDQKPSKAS